MKRRVFPVLLAIAIGTSLCGAQNQQVLRITTGKPVVDGAVGATEYPLTLDLPNAKLYLCRTADALHVAVSAATTGWVAVGLGSPRMDGAAILIGNVVGGKGEVKVQTGRGHSHFDAEAKALLSSAVKESGGRTIMELALDGPLTIAKDSRTLDIIVATGFSDSLASMHSGRTPVRIALE